MRVLFINGGKSPCGIRESGIMAYHALATSEAYSIDYLEISEENLTVPGGYDVYVFNYHIGPMGWLDLPSIKVIQGLKLTLVLEISPNNPFPSLFLPSERQAFFDGFIVLDPTMEYPQKNVFAFPRPLEEQAPRHEYIPKDIPVIGSFGIHGYGKFHNIVDAVNREFERAVVRLNITYPAYNGEIYDSFIKAMIQDCRDRAKKGVEIVVTHDFMSQQELVDWCAENTLNCFLYDRDAAGLSAATDQAILSGRPLAVSNNTTFRHLLQYLHPYPEWSLKRSIEESAPLVRQIREAWTARKFAEQFEGVLRFFADRLSAKATGEAVSLRTINQPPDKKDPRAIVKDIARACYRSTIKKSAFLHGFCKDMHAKITHASPRDVSLKSYSTLYEDIYLYRLFRYNWSGFYVDIGPTHPTQHSITHLLYQREWRGINVVQSQNIQDTFSQQRQRDITLCCAVGVAEESMLSNSGRTLEQICSEHTPRYLTDIDFLSINAIGRQKGIIISGDWQRFRPKVVIVRAVSPDRMVVHHPEAHESEWQDWESFLLEVGYCFILFDGLNRFYLRQEDAFLREYFTVPVSPELDGFKKVVEGREYRLEVEHL